jgi:hypothetical protein
MSEGLRPAMCWTLPDRACPHCGDQIATDGKREWCLNTECHKKRKEITLRCD